MDNDELNLDELENVQAGQSGFSYEENKERFESAMNKFKPVEPKRDDELDLDQLSHVEAGNGLDYEENKKRFEESLDRTKTIDLGLHDPNKVPTSMDNRLITPDDKLGELSEEDLEHYMGGIRIQGEEYYQQR